MIDAAFIKYDSCQKLLEDVILTVMKEGITSIICNFLDYGGLISALNEKTINHQSFFLDAESAERFDDDIDTARMNDGNMLITILDTGRIIGEPIVFQKAESFAPITYWVEYDAKSAISYPLSGTIVPFRICCPIMGNEQ